MNDSVFGEIPKEAHDSHASPGSTVLELNKTVMAYVDPYVDELYNPNFQSLSAAFTLTPTLSPQINNVFTRRLQAVNNQHLSASNTQTPLTISSRERSPFRQGS